LHPQCTERLPTCLHCLPACSPCAERQGGWPRDGRPLLDLVCRRPEGACRGGRLRGGPVWCVSCRQLGTAGWVARFTGATQLMQAGLSTRQQHCLLLPACPDPLPLPTPCRRV
jgi:hypothetical protein